MIEKDLTDNWNDEKTWKDSITIKESLRARD